jgi:DNA-binding NtrC family response regulator/CHASE2 domain-containing sensor protein
MSARSAWNTERKGLLAAAGCVAGAFVLSFLLALLFPAFFRGWNDRIIDGFFKFRYRLAGRGEISPELVHVVVDDSTYSSLGLPARDRGAFAQAFDLLQQAGARLIACDVLFRDPEYPETDRLLVEAASKARCVILPLVVSPGRLSGSLDSASRRCLLHPAVRKAGRPPDGSHVLGPFPDLSAQAAGFGHINASPDPDGRIRRLPLLYRRGNGYVPALSLMAVLEYFQLGPQDMEVFFGRRLVLRGARLGEDLRQDLFIPIDREGRIRINFAGPTGVFQSFPVHKLLAAQRQAETRSHLHDLLEGALVVLSDTSTANKDYGPGIFEGVYPLSGLHVNVINSILTSNFLSEQGTPGAVLAALLLAVSLFLAAARFKPMGFILAGVLLYAVFLLTSAGLFLWGRIAPSVAIPTLGAGLALVSASARSLLRAEREKARSQTGLAAADKAIAEQKHELEIANRLLERLTRLAQDGPPEDFTALGQPAEGAGLPEKPASLQHPEAFSEVVTRNRQMLATFRYIEAIADDGHPVLITGESGVGKELVAGAIHRLSRRQGKFVSENIAGLDDTLFTDTLFGHARGAFTDAGIARKGLVEEAAGGTLFLDEIGDLSIGSQVKLLRLMEEREYRPLGMDEVRMADARIIIATNVNLEKKLEEGQFRQDLYFRLTHRIHIPPLRERLDDLPLLVEHFLQLEAQARGVAMPAVPRELLAVLESYAFPGNIRELKNMLDNAWSGNGARPPSLPYLKEYVRRALSTNLHQDVQLTFVGKFPSLQEVERAVVTEALKRANGNQGAAAGLLGLSASALSRRLSRYRKSGDQS